VVVEDLQASLTFYYPAWIILGKSFELYFVCPVGVSSIVLTTVEITMVLHSLQLASSSSAPKLLRQMARRVPLP